MAFTPLNRILPQAIRQAGLENTVSSVRIVEEAQAALLRLWGPERAAYVRVVSFREGTLTIALTSPAASHGLREIETTWLNEIHRALGGKRIQKVVTRREGF